MRLPERRWLVGGLAAALLCAVVVVLVRAPAPAVSGPSTADFTALDAAGRQNAVVLGTDLTNGVAQAAPFPVPSTAPLPVPSTVDSVDGLTVSYEGSLTVGVAEPLLFQVTRDGAPVPVQRYL